ncbi:MAG TPA: AtzE family amidohydrolase [Caulobacteraceae bacterium]|jgi:AtzE family amidohydrolase|nr:AtzE family amidohydrolase [Caulobacteraceae bacterium]
MTRNITDALGLAERVREGLDSAESIVATCLSDIAARDPALNCFTAVLADQARADAAAIDARLRAGAPVGPLAGVPFAVKNLFDIEGLTTLAGSKILAGRPAATRDASVVQRLRAAGAILVGALNMDEFAYGFSTENSHYGATRNPHDPTRIAGGSSGGSAAAVSAGFVPIALGSDTNGSIRVPAALCGVFGLKPTYGRLSRAGSFPFVDSLDHVGPFARTVRDLAAAYDAMQGADADDPACSPPDDQPILPTLDTTERGLRIGILGGWFRQGASEEALAAVDRVAAAFGEHAGAAKVVNVDLAGAQAARSAAFCLTGAEGGSLHRRRLSERPLDFDPATRDRLLAGLMLPAGVLVECRRVRRQFQAEARALFETVDLLLAPATPCAAPRIGESIVNIAGRDTPVRANLGLYTQPISFIGLPAISAPVTEVGPLPLGVQLIAPAWREDRLLQAAHWLEQTGVTRAPAPIA